MSLIFQILHYDTSFTAEALVRLMVDLNEKRLEVMDRNRDRQEPRFSDVVDTFQLLMSQLSEARHLLEVRHQQELEITQNQSSKTEILCFLFTATACLQEAKRKLRQYIEMRHTPDLLAG